MDRDHGPNFVGSQDLAHAIQVDIKYILINISEDGSSGRLFRLFRFVDTGGQLE
jgi:hypothetical protein